MIFELSIYLFIGSY